MKGFSVDPLSIILRATVFTGGGTLTKHPSNPPTLQGCMCAHVRDCRCGAVRICRDARVKLCRCEGVHTSIKTLNVTVGFKIALLSRGGLGNSALLVNVRVCALGSVAECVSKKRFPEKIVKNI